MDSAGTMPEPARGEVTMRAATTVLGISLLAIAPAAFAGAPCTIRTVTGTYAVQITGNSFVGEILPVGAYQLHGGSAVLVAELTIAPDGSVRGPMWGVYVAEPVEFPFSARISIDADCTGELLEEDGSSFKLVVLDNGAEIRWVPWEGFGGSVGTWHRITRSGDPAPRCGQHSFKGRYMMRCDGYDLTGEGYGLASGWALFLLSAKEGALTGRVYLKQFGLPSSVLTESAVSGTYTVHEDCTLDSDFSFDVLPPGLAFKARGVLFDQGRQAYGLPLGIYAGETMVAPVLPLTCGLTRIEP